MKLLSALLLLTATSPAFAASAAQPARIGAAAAVKGVVKAAIPGAVGRVIGSGKPLFLNDHVTTDAQGKLQVLLLDETVFTLGPNADMVLDTFVYDPDTGAGQIAANITKGAFRFVTGKVAGKKPENMSVKLKVGTIGVRGTVVVGETGPEGSTVINAGAASGNNAGEPASNVLAENNGQSTLISRPGEGVRMTPGARPGAPSDMSGELNRISNSLSVEPPKNQQASGGPGGDADKESGESTGKGLGNSEDGGILAGASDDTQTLVSAAIQQGFGAAKWSDLAYLQGKATYTGGGTSVCTGGSGPSCGGGITGNNYSFAIPVDFDAKTIGGAGSNVSVSVGGPASSASSAINVMSYAGKDGFAETNLSMVNSAFNGTNISFTNANGEVASELQFELKYQDFSGHLLNGTATGTK